MNLLGIEELKPYVFVDKHDKDGLSMKYYFKIFVQDSVEKRQVKLKETNPVRIVDGEQFNNTFEIVLDFDEYGSAAQTGGLSHVTVVIPEIDLPPSRKYTIIVVEKPGKPIGSGSVIVKNNDQEDD